MKTSILRHPASEVEYDGFLGYWLGREEPNVGARVQRSKQDQEEEEASSWQGQQLLGET